MMKKLFAIVGCSLLLGCAGEQDALRSELEAKDALVLGLQMQLEAAQASSRKALEEQAWDAEAAAQKQREACKNVEEEYEQTVRLMRVQIKERDETITALRKEVSKTPSRSTSPHILNSPVAVHVVPVSDAIANGGKDVGRGLPLAISNIRAEKVVTGSHVAQELVETEETYRDDFGKLNHVVDWKEKTVSQYDHHIVFSVSNRTDYPQTLYARAGSAENSYALSSYEALTNIFVKAAVGAALKIRVGVQSESYQVDYP